MSIPEDFLAKILKQLVFAGLLESTRGAHGGYKLTRGPREITFLDVIEAIEGRIQINVCTGPDAAHECNMTLHCSMHHVWRVGQERMLEVYRQTTLDALAMPHLKPDA